MPGSKYAWGSQAWGLCQRCGERFYLRNLVFDGYMPGLRVCVDCYDPRHPQEFLQDVTDPTALWKPAPDGVSFTAPVLTSSSGVSIPVVLNWTVADFGAYTVGGYSVYRAPQSTGIFALLATFNNTENILQNGQPGITETLTYSDSTVVANTEYLYYVQAFSLTYAADPQPPAWPSGPSGPPPIEPPIPYVVPSNTLVITPT
jgi:hypothetical protein